MPLLLLAAATLSGLASAALPACPAELEKLGTTSCAAGDTELLTDPGFAGPAGGQGWGNYVVQGVTATISLGVPGATVNISERANPQINDAVLFQTVELSTASGASYELCVQAGADTANSHLRFAADNGGNPDYNVVQDLPREVLALPVPGTVSRCFRFTPSSTAGTYSARIAIEVGDVVGGAKLCQASLRRCAGQLSGSTCPADPLPLDAWKCSPGNLSSELLLDPLFSGAGQGWHEHMQQAALATFKYAAPGVKVVVKDHSPARGDDVVMWQTVNLDANSGAENSVFEYELCMQVVAANGSSHIRFAVDSGPDGNPQYTPLGGQLRTERVLPEKNLTDLCYRFILGPQDSITKGRIALDLGAVAGEISICQASLRKCKSTLSLDRAHNAVRRCYVAPLTKGSGCEELEVLRSSSEFGRNVHGQETSGKLACLERLRQSSAGNTFVFSDGACDLWRCPNRTVLFQSANGTGDASVYSELCEYQEPQGGKLGQDRRSPVFVQLWEWNFPDVAKECEEYLGPNGFNGVQVAPVTEHITGPSWFTKYQPVSFILSSRSGSAAQFADMVRRCRAAGVEVIVDVVLNHVARPCLEVSTSQDPMPCRGWQRTPFGNRRVRALGTDGWQDRGPEHFHHLANDDMRNCAVETKSGTYQCPDSNPPNDCAQCDMYGMPDWATELPAVQDVLRKHLQELHSIGVSMLRIDAASYVHVEDLAAVINSLPWDYVVQEWWGGTPPPSRTRFVGHYRDLEYGQKIVHAIASLPSRFSELLNITHGVDGIAPEDALYVLALHDHRTLNANSTVPTYKNGLEFHQQQKFLLAWPQGSAVRLFGGFGWKHMNDGPPGCDHDESNLWCNPDAIFNNAGEPQCMATPTLSPLDWGLTSLRQWTCEHRWEGIAGLVAFRKACRGLPVTETWSDKSPVGRRVDQGRVAFRAGQDCFVALQRGYNTKITSPINSPGDWRLDSFATGMPQGTYCDLASMHTMKDWDRRSCPRTVSIGADGTVLAGVVPEGDLLAIHAGARLTGGGDGPVQIGAAGRLVKPWTCAPLLSLLGLAQVRAAARR